MVDNADMDTPDNLHVPLCSITYSTPDPTHVYCMYMWCVLYDVCWELRQLCGRGSANEQKICKSMLISSARRDWAADHWEWHLSRHSRLESPVICWWLLAAAVPGYNIRAANDPSVFTISQLRSRAFSWLKANTITVKTLIRHYAKWVSTQGK